MGSMTYDGQVINIEDRVLAHLQIVIMNKLRRGQGFPMSWKDSPMVGDGRSSIWLDEAIPVHFKFDGSKSPVINKTWLAELTASADSSQGLIVTAEAGHLAPLGEHLGQRPNPTIVEPIQAEPQKS